MLRLLEKAVRQAIAQGDGSSFSRSRRQEGRISISPCDQRSQAIFSASWKRDSTVQGEALG
jgi:hypothetical protein